MEPAIPSWQRPFFVAREGAVDPGDEAFVWFVVFGDFSTEMPPADPARYRSAGPNERFTLSMLTRAVHADWFDGWSAERWYPRADLARTDPALATALDAAPGCLDVRVRTPDPETLDDLRDTAGVVAYLLDHGGVAVLDPQTLRYHSPTDWRRDHLGLDEPQPAQHAVILISDDERNPGASWYHTRGMRKFGRPDISIRGVPRSEDGTRLATEICNRMIVHQALGARIPDGQPVRMEGLPEGMVCRLAGDRDDPDFNNVHVEIDWSAART